MALYEVDQDQRGFPMVCAAGRKLTNKEIANKLNRQHDTISKLIGKLEAFEQAADERLTLALSN